MLTCSFSQHLVKIYVINKQCLCTNNCPNFWSCLFHIFCSFLSTYFSVTSIWLSLTFKCRGGGSECAVAKPVPSKDLVLICVHPDFPTFRCPWVGLSKCAQGTIHLRRRHFLGGWGVKNLPNLPTDSSKKMPTKGGRGQKSWIFADVFNGWSLTLTFKVNLECQKLSEAFWNFFYWKSTILD